MVALILIIHSLFSSLLAEFWKFEKLSTRRQNHFQKFRNTMRNRRHEYRRAYLVVVALPATLPWH